MHCIKIFYQTKVVTNHNLQLLCYVTFFDILHRYGVIAASVICSVEKSIVPSYGTDFFFFQFENSITVPVKYSIMYQ